MASGQELLDLALDHARPLVDVGGALPRQGQDDFDLAVTSTALLRKGFLQAAAVRSLAASAVPEAGVPNDHVTATLVSIELNPASTGFGRVKARESWDVPQDFLPFLAACILHSMRQQYHTALPECTQTPLEGAV